MAAPAVTPPFRIRDASWSVDEAALARVRRAVFIVEQQVPEDLEWDSDDARSLHALAEDAAGNPIGTGRLLPDGHIGRLAVIAAWRGRGVGAALLDHLSQAAIRLGHRTLRLNAQTRVADFYRSRGFVHSGVEYLEAGIMHLPMRRDI